MLTGFAEPRSKGIDIEGKLGEVGERADELVSRVQVPELQDEPKKDKKETVGVKGR